jgi:hypothetical protein
VHALGAGEPFAFGEGGVEVGLELVAFGFEVGYPFGLAAACGGLAVPVVALPFSMGLRHTLPSRDDWLAATLMSRDARQRHLAFGGSASPLPHRSHSGLPAGPYRVVVVPQREQWPVTGRGLSLGPVAMISMGPRMYASRARMLSPMSGSTGMWFAGLQVRKPGQRVTGRPEYSRLTKIGGSICQSAMSGFVSIFASKLRNAHLPPPGTYLPRFLDSRVSCKPRY